MVGAHNSGVVSRLRAVRCGTCCRGAEAAPASRVALIRGDQPSCPNEARSAGTGNDSPVAPLDESRSGPFHRGSRDPPDAVCFCAEANSIESFLNETNEKFASAACPILCCNGY